MFLVSLILAALTLLKIFANNKNISMLNLILDIISFPVKAIKKVPVKYRFYVAVAFAFAAAACFITANQGYGRTVFSILGWVSALAVVDVFWYANAEEKE